MSVEHLSRVESSAADGKINAPTEDTTMIRSVVEDDEKRKSEHQETSANGSESQIIMKETTIPSPVRDWFENLSATEKASALGFVDGPFLETLLSFASSSSWSPGAAAAAAKTRLEGAFTGGNVINWSKMVRIKDFETQLAERQKAPLLKKPTDGSNVVVKDLPDGETASFGKNGAGGSGESNKSPEEEPVVDSNAFRIHNDNDLQSSKQPAMESLLQKQDYKEETRQKEDLFVCPLVFDRLSITFPSAFRHATGKVVDEHLPFVTLHPSCFESIDDKQLFHELDAFSLSVFRRKFLARDATNSREILGCKQSKKNQDGSLPLSAFVLARLESSAFESFKETKGRLSTKGSVDDEAKRPNAIFGDLVSYARAVDDMAMTMDSATLQDFTSPLLSSLGVTISHSVLKLQSLSLTPFQWLAVVAGDRKIDFTALDQQVQASLQRMEDQGSSASAPAPSKDEIEEVHKVPNRKEAQSKKNKKRKTHKRRRRKASNTDKMGVSPKNALAETESNAERDPIESEDALRPCPGNEREKKTPAVEKKALTEKIEESVTEATDDEVTPNEDVEVFAAKDLESVTSIDSSHGEKAEVAATPNAPTNGDITISRVEGVLRVSAPAAEQLDASAANASPGDAQATGETKEEDDGHAWETVAQKAKGNRKKGSNHSVSRHGTNNGANESHGASSKKNKGKRSSDSRKKARSTKIAREVINSILNKVDEEVKRKKPVAAQPAVNPWKVGQKTNSSPTRTANGGDEAAKESKAPSVKTLRDLVVEGKGSAAAAKMSVSPAAAAAAAAAAAPPQNRFIPVDPRSPPRRDHITRSKASPTQRLKGNVAIAADQNTAPTYQETVSAVSSPSNAAVESKEGRNSVEEQISKTDTSSESTEEAPQNQGRVPLTPSKKHTPQDPPLPTLLSPENANSASSSVASSLEVPHGGNRHHHSNCSVDTNDVGCHLLDVCDRLSKEMALFMSRRNLALTARRRERGALLAALQDTVSAIWPGGGHVELYGSCATQLDLPSSDLDVVVIGLDRAPDAAGQSQFESASADTAAETKASKSKDSSLSPDDSNQTKAQQSLTLPQYVGLSLHRNAERVVRLASALEAQPWAVQVNAIPTASVPVVKILADPSRLKSTTHGGDLSAHCEEMVTQASTGAGNAAPRQLDEDEAARQQFNHQPWRGADVMNGLLSLDITFEGPEHGGLGSTEFSARAVAEACKETGLQPDATPFVQALMVLKELLAQRKLNEPYSGGLSSYALLLLVLGLVRERAAIKEELERVEQQRRAMAAIDSSASYSSANEVKNQDTSSVPASSGAKATKSEQSGKPKGGKVTTPQKTTKKGPEKRQKAVSPASPGAKGSAVVTPAESPKLKASSASSWASIARKPSTLSIGSVSQESLGKQSEEGTPKPSVSNAKPSLLAKKPSFAEAVARSTVSAPKAAAKDTKKAPQNKSKSQNTSVSKTAPQDTKKAPQKKPASALKPAPQDTPSKEKEPSARTVRTDSITQQSSDTPQMRNSDGPSVGPTSVAPAASPADPQIMPVLPFYAQGFNDIVEVLCSGETTAGKLLMHFLLYYGEHFDAHTTSIDISGKHDRGYMNQIMSPYPYLSPYIPRMSHGHIDPVTGMLTVDPIVIYDPLEGAENNNVARRCFAWNSVRWIFAQSYATLSSAVERSATPPASHAGAKHTSAVAWDGQQQLHSSGPYSLADDVTGDLMDPSSSLLRCLLSF